MSAEDVKSSTSAEVQVMPKALAEALNVKKTPPPEPPAQLNTRRLVVLSFWIVAVFLGLPTWWWTTSVYRAPLPLKQMADWSDGKVCRPTFPLRIAVDAPSLSSQETQHLLQTTQHALDDLNDFSAHHLRLIQAGGKGIGSKSQDDVALTIKLVPVEHGQTARSELHGHLPVLTTYYAPNQIPSPSSSTSPLGTFLAQKLQNIYSEEQAALSHLLANTPWANTGLKPVSHEQAEDLAKQKTRSFKYAPTYHLTFSLFTPGSAPSDWDIEAALQESITPLLKSFSSISNFTVDTQVQLFAHSSPSMPGPTLDEKSKEWVLNHADLSGFINAAEWPLSPSIGEGPTINFVLYIPSADQSPLVIGDGGANSWLIPQWGGVRILNPVSTHAGQPVQLSKDQLQPVMQTFSNQLQMLLGLPHLPESFPLRIATLTRVHVASLIYSAASTLGALGRLTKTLPSIAIPDAVLASVRATITHLDSACADLRSGRFHGALQHARIAEAAAEKAFFEKSMVGQVYFPDEHKIVIYLPFLLPVTLPLFVSAVKIIKGYKKQEGSA